MAWPVHAALTDPSHGLKTHRDLRALPHAILQLWKGKQPGSLQPTNFYSCPSGIDIMLFGRLFSRNMAHSFDDCNLESLLKHHLVVKRISISFSLSLARDCE
jgi:hypothetical protein